MSIVTSYPGVYIVEKPSGNRTIVGVGTSITAFLGRANQGPAEDPILVTTFADYERRFGSLTRDSGLGYAVQDFFLNGGNQALIVRLVHKRAANAPATDTTTDAVARTWVADLGATNVQISASGPGAWAAPLSVVIRYPGDPGALSAAEAADVAQSQGVDADDLFDLVVLSAGEEVDLHRNVTLVNGSRRVDRVLDGSPFVEVTPALPDALPAGDPTRPPQGALPAGVAGADGSDPDAADYGRGLDSLKRAELVNLVCLPPLRPAADLPDGIWAPAAAACADPSLRAFLIVDPPAALDSPADVTTWARGPLGLNGIAAGHAAVYFPRLVRPDPLRGGAASTFAPCGAVAGTFARTDASRGVWKAPAGIEAGLAGSRPALQLTDDENGELNPIGVNCIRTFRDTGTVIWGSRTRRGADVLADDYKYVPVRRFALFLEQSLYRGTQWVVFEPNDEPLWSQIRNSIGAFMQDLFRRQAFQGATPRDAYFVQCGKDTTTQYDIDRGIVNIWVGFAPLKPAEFVVITIQQKVAQPA